MGLAASFNGFDAAALPLAREPGAGWTAVVPLPPGTYEYAFVVDGRWTADPAAGAAAPRAGRTVSLRQVR